MRTAQDVIEKLKQEAPEQSICYFDYDYHVSIRLRTWALILPGYCPENRIGGHFRECFERSQRIEKAPLCTLRGKRGHYMIIGFWSDSKKVTIIKRVILKKFSFPGCLLSYDPISHMVFFSDELYQPYALVMPIIANADYITTIREAITL